MPTVEKTHGNVVTIRGVGRFERGDRAEVHEDLAEYLVEERGDFELVDGNLDEDDSDTCDVVKSDGDVCGRDLPCRYHTEDED